MSKLSRTALGVAIIAAATIGGAWIFESFGYAPCELCLKERIPYYVGIPVALVAFALASRTPNRLAAAVLAVAALIFAGSAVFGAYHAGVEFGFWPGPSDCTGAYSGAASTQDFLKQLNTIQVVRCDAVAVRVLGLSLAAWNAVISAALALLAGWGAVAGFSERGR